MSNLDAKKVESIQQEISLGIDNMLTNYLKTYEQKFSCKEEEVAKACHLLRQKYSNKVSIDYQRPSKDPSYLIEVENQSL